MQGEINVDQAHRGYDVTVDDTGKSWFNPFYMKYSPSADGYFDGQRGYGYVSIEKFVDAARAAGPPVGHDEVLRLDVTVEHVRVVARCDGVAHLFAHSKVHSKVTERVSNKTK